MAAAISVVFSLLLTLLGMIFPALSLIMTVVAGTPMVFLGVRHGTRISGIAAVAAVLFLMILTGNIFSSLLVGIMSLLPGVVLGNALKGRKPFSTTVFAGAGVVLFGFMLQLVLLNAAGDGHGIENLVHESLESSKQMMETALSVTGDKNPEQVQLLQKSWNAAIGQIEDMIFLFFPAFLIGASVVWSYLCLMIGIFLLNKFHAKRVLYRPFYTLCASRSMCYAAMLMFLMTSFSQDSTIWTAALKNVVVLLYAYFAVCGLSLIDYKLKEKLPSGFGRAAVYLAVFALGYVLMGMLFQGLCVLGTLDGILQFRRFHKAGGNHVGRE